MPGVTAGGRRAPGMGRPRTTPAGLSPAGSQRGGEALLDGEVTDTLAGSAGVGLELCRDGREPLAGRDGRAGHDPEPRRPDVADDGVAGPAEPEQHPRVEHLVRRRVPAVGEDQGPRRRQSVPVADAAGRAGVEAGDR